MGDLGGREQFGGLWPATIWHNFNAGWLEATKSPIATFPTCPSASRGPQAAAGANDPFGILNGGGYRDPSAEPASPNPQRPIVIIPPSTTSTTTTTRRPRGQ